jgi:hypothetical protein
MSGLSQSVISSFANVFLVQSASSNAVTPGQVTGAVVQGLLDIDGLFSNSAYGTPIKQLWTLRNSHTVMYKAPADGIAYTNAEYNAFFPVELLLANIPGAYILESNSANSVQLIDDLLSLTNPDGTKIFPDFTTFYGVLANLTPDAGMLNVADIDMWKTLKLTITPTDSILLVDITEVLKNWSSLKTRVTYHISNTFDTNAVTASVDNDFIAVADAGDGTANKAAYLAAAATTPAAALVAATANTEAAIKTAVLATIVKLYTAADKADDNDIPDITKVVLVPAPADQTKTTTFVTYVKSSVDAVFQYAKTFIKASSQEDFISNFSSIFTANTFIFENAINAVLLKKYFSATKVSDIVTLVSSAGYAVNATVVSWSGLVNYVNVTSTNEQLVSAYSGLFLVLSTLGYSAADAYKACVDKIVEAIITGEAVGTGKVYPTILVLRATDFNNYFNNYIFTLPVLNRLAGLKTDTVTPGVQTAVNYSLLTAADKLSDIHSAIVKNAGATPAKLAALTAQTTIAGVTVDKTVLRSIEAGDSMAASTGTNVNPGQFGAPNMKFDSLYSKIPEYTKSFNLMYNFNSQSFAIVKKSAVTAVATAATSNVPSAADFALKTSDNLVAFYTYIAQQYVLLNTVGALPLEKAVQNFQFANRAATTTDLLAEDSLHDLIFQEKADPQVLLNLPVLQSWMHGASNATGSIVRLFMMMIVDATVNKWNATYFAQQILIYAGSGTNGLANCIAAVTEIVTTAATGKAANATKIYNALVAVATKNIDFVHIQAMMGIDNVTQLAQLNLMLAAINYAVLQKYTYFFTNKIYTLSELLTNLTPLIVQTDVVTTASLGSVVWPTLFTNNIAFLAGTKEDKQQLSPAIVLSYKRLILACNKLNGVSAANSDFTQLLFAPEQVKLAYGLTDAELNTLGNDQGVSFI